MYPIKKDENNISIEGNFFSTMYNVLIYKENTIKFPT